MSKILSLLVVVFLNIAFQINAYAQTSTPLKPIIDWQKRLTAQDRLTAFGDDLMGDQIDPNMGSLVFEHTDISLPGNNGLDVSIRRRLTQGYKYDEGVNVEFGDWELVVPKITAIATAQMGWAGQRCNGSWEQNFPQMSTGPSASILRRHGYMDGVSVAIPGQGSQTMLRGSSSGQFPSTAKAQTASQWYFTCTTATDGKEGFVGHAPNGHKYHFTKFISRPYKELGFAQTSYKVPRLKIILAATLVEDVHGNSVSYNYLGDKLTSIQASDGRAITLGYAGNLISSVTANNRVWSYSYRTSVYVKHDSDVNYQGPFQSQVLDKVTQPDDRYWEFDLDGMQSEPSPTAKLLCGSGGGPITLKHPYGATGSFTLRDIRHRQAYKYYNTVTYDCGHASDAESPSIVPSISVPPPHLEIKSTRSLAVISKSITHPSMPEAIWTFDYEEDAVCGILGVTCGHQTSTALLANSPANQYYISLSNAAPYESDVVYTSSGGNPLDYTNWTKVTQPDGSILTYYHHWNWEEMFGGKQIRQETHKDGILISETDTVFIQQGCASGAIATGVGSKASKCFTNTSKTTQSRDGDTYYSETDYNTNPAASNYSFGKPVQTRQWSSVSTTPRITDTEYEHNTAKWILGLPLSTTINGRNTATYVYNGLGQKTSQTRYGAPHATFGYHAEGTTAWFEDANGRKTSANDWKRGTPQHILRADTTSLYQYVDNNGWLTSTIDAMSNTTSYTRDTMGRLTMFTPPAGRAPTSVSYSFGSDTVQTITNVQSESSITYDSMFRPILVESKDLSTGNSTFINTEYDAAGRAIFTSFPSINAASTSGTDTSYDGLGRVTGTTETVAPYAATSTQYLPGHKTRVTDAAGNQTTTTKNGFGELTQILQPLGVTTDMNLNQWGEILSLRQWGAAVDQTHTYKYGSDRRICRHHTPESGDTLTAYDPAGQMITLARGQASGGGCSAPSGTAKVTLGYDLLGRSTTTTYSDTTTPNITRTYDGNGNVLAVNRGVGANAVNWAYGYDIHNTLISEALSLDSKTYASSYGYNSAGHMMWRTLPSGNILAFENDGLGRQTRIAGGGYDDHVHRRDSRQYA